MLKTSILTTTEINDMDRTAMFHLYDSYYQGASRKVFRMDLDDKDYVIALKDHEGVIRGFSTLAIFNERFYESKIRVIFSGDTIVDKAYWGQNPLSQTWIEFAGHIKAGAPEIPLYWLLIVKGHRTYRYLSIFSNQYFPRYERETPAEYQELMHYLGNERFGDSYNPESGLVLFPEPRSYLIPELAVIPDKDRERPEIKYFLERNPQYYEGDELLCLCELQEQNLTNLASRWFKDGDSQRYFNDSRKLHLQPT